MQTVLITGASGGIGRAVAQCFAQNGWNVALHYHKNEQAALELEQSLSKQTGAKAFQADLADSEQVEALIAQVTHVFGRVDALVNNAGIAQQKLLTELTDADWHTMFDVNMHSVFYACRAALRQMIARHSGSIVNVSSIWGVTGASCEVHYSAAKAAVIGFSKALAKEVGPAGIRVNCVAPGVIDTQMNNCLDKQTLCALAEETPLGRIGTPQDTAELIFFLCSDKASFLTGQVICADGGLIV